MKELLEMNGKTIDKVNAWKL